VIIFPAIDLKDGNAVRLEEGDMDRSRVFNEDPAAQARAFEAAGFEWLHLVDLNGAFEGAPVNGAAVEEILAATSAKAQLGGGIRDRATIDLWLEKGLARVILGTAALRDPALVQEAAKDLPGRIVVGVDARDGMVAVEGWADVSDMPAIELAKQFEGAGVAAIIYTDISRDGLLKGVNVEATAKLAEAVSIPVIASGGLNGVSDITALKAHPGIAGAVVGRALYDGTLEPAEAIKAALG
jgi:phosphoribosylformimino-5-aminoimidazole carboxamide ribotide isomerase